MLDNYIPRKHLFRYRWYIKTPNGYTEAVHLLENIGSVLLKIIIGGILSLIGIVLILGFLVG